MTRADALALAVVFVARLLGARHDRLGAAEVDDHVAALEALDLPLTTSPTRSMYSL